MALAVNAGMETFSKGEFVAAVWCGEWWVAKVQQPLVHDRYALKFMHHLSFIDPSLSEVDNSEKYYGVWPECDDLLDVAYADILCPTSKPTKTNYDGLPCFTLTVKETGTINIMFQKFQDSVEGVSV